MTHKTLPGSFSSSTYPQSAIFGKKLTFRRFSSQKKSSKLRKRWKGLRQQPVQSASLSRQRAQER